MDLLDCCKQHRRASLSWVLKQKAAHPLFQNCKAPIISLLAGLTPTVVSGAGAPALPRSVPPCPAEAPSPPMGDAPPVAACPKGTLLGFGHLTAQDPQALLCQLLPSRASPGAGQGSSPGPGTCWAPFIPWPFSLAWAPSKWQQNHLMAQQPPWIKTLNLDAEAKLDEQTKEKFCWSESAVCSSTYFPSTLAECLSQKSKISLNWNSLIQALLHHSVITRTRLCWEVSLQVFHLGFLVYIFQLSAEGISVIDTEELHLATPSYLINRLCRERGYIAFILWLAAVCSMQITDYQTHIPIPQLSSVNYLLL